MTAGTDGAGEVHHAGLHLEKSWEQILQMVKKVMEIVINSGYPLVN